MLLREDNRVFELNLKLVFEIGGKPEFIHELDSVSIHFFFILLFN